MAILSNLIKLVAPKPKVAKPTALTNTFNPSSTGQALAVPAYRDHLTDLSTYRASYDSRTVLKTIFAQDPDVSAALNAYLTVAATEPVFYVRDLNGQFDEAGFQTVQQLIQSLCTRTDYSTGFALVKGWDQLCENLRYMVLLRGMLSVELVLNKFKLPDYFNIIDSATIEWYEPESGKFSPKQRPKSGGNPIDLSGLVTLFIATYRQDPTEIYPTGPWVSAINTIVARQQVINDLYRLMQVSGYPRVAVKVIEEVLLKNAPTNVKEDPQAQSTWVRARLQEIANGFSTIRPDQAYVHTDSIETYIMNEKQPAMAVDISPVVEILNAQNQAALKTMATIIGRGTSGVNTASVEARIFAMNADEINKPVAEVLSQALTYGLRLLGSESSVQVKFRQAEMRSALELEPQLALKTARLKSDLSLGVITDLEYHMEMYGRPPPAGAPQLSGTGFDTGSTAATADTAANTSGNTDSLGRSMGGSSATKAGKASRSNGVPK